MDDRESLHDFVKKYGTHGLGLVVSEFIERAPSFPGDEALAKQIGEMIGSLEDGLKDWLKS